MKPKNPQDSKIAFILGTFFLTIITFYIAIPKFIDLEKYQKLSNRLDIINEWDNNNNNENKRPPNNNQGSNSSNNTQNNPSKNPNAESNQEENNVDLPNYNENNNSNDTENNEQNNDFQNPELPTEPDIVKPDEPPKEETNPPIIEENPPVEPSKEKTFTVKFNQNGADQIETNELKCTTKNDSCTITLPKITKENGEVHGWNKNKYAQDGITVNSTYKVTENHNLYAITSKTNTVTFDPNGATLNFTSSNCKTFNQEKSCVINTPTITRENGYGIGFSKNANATTSSYNSNISISSNLNLFAISASDFTAYFNPNGAFYIGAKSLSCKVYNKNKSCNIISPTIEKDSYTTLGWNSNSEATTVTYQIGSSITLNKNANFYAIRRINNTGFLTTEAYNGLSLVNQLRTSNNVPALKWSKSLEHSAELRVLEIIKGYDPLNPHKRPDGREFYTVNDLAYGESWTTAFQGTALEMYQNFFNSPPHKAAMLDKSYKTIGISGYKNPSDGVYYWVQLFGN